MTLAMHLPSAVKLLRVKRMRIDAANAAVLEQRVVVAGIEAQITALEGRLFGIRQEMAVHEHWGIENRQRLHSVLSIFLARRESFLEAVRLTEAEIDKARSALTSAREELAVRLKRLALLKSQFEALDERRRKFVAQRNDRLEEISAEEFSRPGTAMAGY